MLIIDYHPWIGPIYSAASINDMTSSLKQVVDDSQERGSLDSQLNSLWNRLCNPGNWGFGHRALIELPMVTHDPDDDYQPPYHATLYRLSKTDWRKYLNIKDATGNLDVKLPGKLSRINDALDGGNANEGHKSKIWRAPVTLKVAAFDFSGAYPAQYRLFYVDYTPEPEEKYKIPQSIAPAFATIRI